MNKMIFCLITLLFPYVSMAQTDCKIPEYLNKIEGFNLASCTYSEYNEYVFNYYNNENKYMELVKGGVFYRLNFEKNESETRHISGDYIRQNYLNAVLKVKGESLSREKVMFKFQHENKTVYMLIDNANDSDDQGYQVYLIEEAAMEQEIEISIKDAIAAEGKAALYGIFFDVDKSVVKPESELELNVVISYLNDNPSVKIFVVGHTDNTGDFAHNLKLSKERAASVVDYLINKGKIESDRLTPDGVGPLCPVTSNANEDGRKKNRRVEIVLR